MSLPVAMRYQRSLVSAHAIRLEEITCRPGLAPPPKIGVANCSGFAESAPAAPQARYEMGAEQFDSWPVGRSPLAGWLNVRSLRLAEPPAPPTRSQLAR
jgi:hypothetical protein